MGGVSASSPRSGDVAPASAASDKPRRSLAPRSTGVSPGIDQRTRGASFAGTAARLVPRAAAELARWTRIGVRKAEALAVAALLERGLSEDGAWKKTP